MLNRKISALNSNLGCKNIQLLSVLYKLHKYLVQSGCVGCSDEIIDWSRIQNIQVKEYVGEWWLRNFELEKIK